MQRQKTYSCGICNTTPDQMSHHKAHLETEKHQTKAELFKLQLEKLSEKELQDKYNTSDYEVILEGLINITSDYIITSNIEKIVPNKKIDNKKLKAKQQNKDDITTSNISNTSSTSNTSNTTNHTISMAEIQEMQEQFQITNRDALRDKIHEIHNFLRNNG